MRRRHHVIFSVCTSGVLQLRSLVLAKLAWPARTPDLSVPDFFHWGRFRDETRLFKTKELRQALVDKVVAIDEGLQIQRRLYDNYHKHWKNAMTLTEAIFHVLLLGCNNKIILIFLVSEFLLK